MDTTNLRHLKRRCSLQLSLMVLLFLGISVGYAKSDVMVHVFGQKELITGNYTSFCNDNNGFLWIGTEAGLIRFDGNNSDLYRNEGQNTSSISDNKIVSLYSDTKGRTWVGTVDGLNLYKGESDSFSLVTLPGMLLNGYVRDIVEFPDGKILYLVSGIGLYTVEESRDGNGNLVMEAKSLNFKFDDKSGISRLIMNSGKDIFFSTISGHVCRLTPDSKVERLAKIDGNVSQISWEGPNSLILSSQYEVYRLNLNDKSLTPLKIDGGKSIKVTDLCSSEGITYVATAGDGMWEVDANTSRIVRADRLNFSTLERSLLKIGRLFIDRSGNLWMGCNHKGVAMAPVDDGSFVMKSFASILREEGGAELTCMCMAGDYIVVGLNSGKVLFLHNDGGVRKVEVSQGAPITSLSDFGNGRILVGVAREGIWSIDVSSLSLSKVMKPSSPYPGVVCSTCGNGNIIAAFGELGVLRYNPVTHEEKWFYPVGGSNLLSCLYYAGISTTSDGKVWIGGYSGIACYDPNFDSLVPIDQTPFIKGVINDVCDYDGALMIATDRGLLRYSPDKGIIRKYTVFDGLPDNDVRTVENDGKGGIWIGTMKGAAYLRESTDGISSLGSLVGQAPSAFLFSGSRNSGSEIAMANFESIVIFDSDSLRQSSFGGNVYLSGIYVNGNRLTEESRSGSGLMVEGPISHPEVIHLSHKDNSLVLRLSTFDFRDSSGIRYEWQIDNEGDEWHSTSPGESMIYLPPLASGKHMLRIRGWENNVHSDVTRLKLDVKAPWYLSNIAYSAYVVMILLMIGLIFKVVKNKQEEELYEAKIKYFMDISHELRSPVTLMLSPVETLLKQNHSPETTSKLLTIRRNAQRVLNLVDQLLDLRKIEKGKMKLVFTPVDIKVFVGELVEMFTPMAEEKGLSISFYCNLKDLWGEVDRNNLDKILVNLISNAIKYTPKGGKVDVALKKSDETLGVPAYSVTVTDTGIGLDNKVISHLFERFYRNVEHHHGNASGFGIGLDLCMRLVELHKGKITAKNREDGLKGSVFTVTLPLTPVSPVSNPVVDTDQKRQRILDVISGSGDSGLSGKSSHRFRILVVDDDVELREYIKTNLGNSFKVVAVPGAEEALKEIRTRLPDLIVTDIRMKGIDGLELLRRIKSNMATQHIPVIIFSSASNVEERTKGWKIGADGYLAKPFTIEELESMVSGLLSTRSKLKGIFSGYNEIADKIEAPKVKGIDEHLMRRINKYINDNISEPSMSVDGLSEYVGLSRSQLHRRMKEIIGVAPSDYIRNVKLRKACEILSQGDVDIVQVAYSLGFNAQSHFSTLFKKYTGMTPTEFRSKGKTGKWEDKSDADENSDNT